MNSSSRDRAPSAGGPLPAANRSAEVPAADAAAPVRRRLARLDASLGMHWSLSNRGDPRCCALADRHYSRQKVGSPQFMPPGACVVLYARTRDGGEAVWGASMPIAAYVKHAWAGAWMCSIFRNEGAGRAHRLIREAVAATRAIAGDPPPLGMVTFIDSEEVRPFVRRNAAGDTLDSFWGQTYRQAGFRPVGRTKGGLLALQLLPEDFPPPISPSGHNNQAFLEFSAA